MNSSSSQYLSALPLATLASSENNLQLESLHHQAKVYVPSATLLAIHATLHAPHAAVFTALNAEVFTALSVAVFKALNAMVFTVMSAVVDKALNATAFKALNATIFTALSVTVYIAVYAAVYDAACHDCSCSLCSYQ